MSVTVEEATPDELKRWTDNVCGQGAWDKKEAECLAAGKSPEWYVETMRRFCKEWHEDFYAVASWPSILGE